MNVKCTAIAIVAGPAPTTWVSAWAQQDPATQTDTTGNDGPQSVVVAGQRHSEDIREIPYSISAISGTDLESPHIDRLEDITCTLSGVFFGASGNAGMASITIRGIRSHGGGTTFGKYLDDVPLVTRTSFAPEAPTSEYLSARPEPIGPIARLSNPLGGVVLCWGRAEIENSRCFG